MQKNFKIIDEIISILYKNHDIFDKKGINKHLLGWLNEFNTFKSIVY